jgi:hypothetical protein
MSQLVFIHGPGAGGCLDRLFRPNWLRVFRSPEASRVGHGGRQQRHTRAVRSEKWGDSVQTPPTLCLPQGALKPTVLD